ncbi:MAG: arylsulfatase [Verrucomicrobiota bacterium]
MKRLVLCALLLAFPCGLRAAAPGKPNIIVILADDMGYSDIGCYGGEIATPNLDGLAAKGLRFTQFYNTARCCPTRASLLTGLYPHQAGIGHMTADTGSDGYRGELNRKCVTIAEALRPAGYATYMTGKWHVTRALEAKTDADRNNWPLQRGFDRFYGTLIGGGSFWDPAFLTRDNAQFSAFADPEYKPEGPYYYTDAISGHAERFVREHHAAKAEQPFFMYVAYTAAHWPMHAKESDIAKYKGRYAAGYDAIRKARYERMVSQGLVKKDATTVTPVPGGLMDTKDWDWDQRNMEVYAAMVDCMDQGIGRLVQALRETGQLDNTLLCYLQDNGGCAEGIGRGGEGVARAEKPTLPPQDLTEVRTQLTPKQTRDGYPVRQGKGVMAGPADTYIAYGQAWASVSNTPFREYKHWVHEGGISTPLIVHWPAAVAAEKGGQLRQDPAHLIDIMATCLDVAGAPYPKEFAGQVLKPLQGVSLRPAFSGEPLKRAEPLFWEHEGNRAVRDGDWKLVAKEDEPWELYDLSADRSEQKNLAAQHPDKVKDLAAKWDAYAARADVLPLGGWKGKKIPKAAANGKAGAAEQRRFELSAGAALAKGKAPNIEARPFEIEAAITVPAAAAGVIIAQGGAAHGYVLYAADGKLNFTLRRKNAATTVSRPLVEGEHTAFAALDAEGRLSLKIDDKGEPVKSEPGPLLRQPADGLQVGRDEGGLVGDYKDTFPFNGGIGKVVLTLGEEK